jgi:manganese/iron transport system permease protein
MLIAPGATAYLLTRRFDHMLAIAVAIAIGASFIGTLLSFHIDGATGPCIVLVQSAIFALAFTITSARKTPAEKTPPHPAANTSANRT